MAGKHGYPGSAQLKSESIYRTSLCVIFYEPIFFLFEELYKPYFCQSAKRTRDFNHYAFKQRITHTFSSQPRKERPRG